MSNLTEEDLAVIAAGIDSTDVETQCGLIPEDAPGRFHLCVAVRAARRARESTVDAIALAAEGHVVDALETSDEAYHYLDTMRDALAKARNEGAQ